MSDMKCMLAGFGGQGVLFAGKVIAHAGLLEGKEVSWLPSYGPEMRGGTANCSVTLSDETIGSPLITHPDVLIAMNQPSFDKFADDVAEDGLIIYDSDLVSPGTVYTNAIGIPASSIAENAGLAGLLNMVLLGKMWNETHFADSDNLDAALTACVPANKTEMLDKNRAAIKAGLGA